MPKNKPINLLPQEEFDASILGRILKWAMSTFRIIVIITEMVVMTAFLSRFWLDAQNSDLSDQIKIKTALIESQADTENTFRDLQTKLAIFKTLKQDVKRTDIIGKIAGQLPQDVSLSTVTITDKETAVKGTAGSELGIAQFVANLKNDKTFKKISLGSVSSSEENPTLTVFTLKLTTQ